MLSPDVDQFYTNGAPGPFSLLHLAAADNNAQDISYLDWMKTGITFTGNEDHSYIGQKIQESMTKNSSTTRTWLVRLERQSRRVPEGPAALHFHQRLRRRGPHRGTMP